MVFFFKTVLNDNSTACTQMVRSRWCNERPMTSSWDCQVKFLPMVVPTKSDRRQSDNVLNCVDNKDTFLKNCPRLRDDGAELSDECNHLKTNNRGCIRGNFKCTVPKPVNQVLYFIHADIVFEIPLYSRRSRRIIFYNLARGYVAALKTYEIVHPMHDVMAR